MNYKYICILLLIFGCAESSNIDASIVSINKDYFNSMVKNMNMEAIKFNLPEDEKFWHKVTFNEIDDFLNEIDGQRPQHLREIQKNNTEADFQKSIIKEMYSKMLEFKGNDNESLRDSIYRSYANVHDFIIVYN